MKISRYMVCITKMLVSVLYILQVFLSCHYQRKRYVSHFLKDFQKLILPSFNSYRTLGLILAVLI